MDTCTESAAKATSVNFRGCASRLVIFVKTSKSSYDRYCSRTSELYLQGALILSAISTAGTDYNNSKFLILKVFIVMATVKMRILQANVDFLKTSNA